MSVAEFSVKDRARFRKLLEVAYSTSFSGERDAALAAAGRIAEAHGMSLREAAGLRDPAAEAPPHQGPPNQGAPRQGQARQGQPRPTGHAGFKADFGAAGPEAMGRWWANRANNRGMNGEARRTALSEAAQMEADKRRHDEALAEAYRRGLDAEERAAAERAAKKRAEPRVHKRTGNRGPWRSRPEFIRVLLTETAMSAKDIAAVAGVTVYDVFREKLLLRRPAAAHSAA